VLLGLASAACVLGQAVLLATMITAVFLHGAGLDAVGAGLGLLAGFVAARAVLAYAQETAAARASAAVASQLRTACCGARSISDRPGFTSAAAVSSPSWRPAASTPSIPTSPDISRS
jgi:ABC-type transport system involved in cytochrome bd biosynthesis fused ATPase/permease subunit